MLISHLTTPDHEVGLTDRLSVSESYRRTPNDALNPQQLVTSGRHVEQIPQTIQYPIN